MAVATRGAAAMTPPRTSVTCASGRAPAPAWRRSSSRRPRVTDVTVVLVAGDGEWTRRRVGRRTRAPAGWANGCRSRSTTCRRSAIRSGCATTTPDAASSANAPPDGSWKTAGYDRGGHDHERFVSNVTDVRIAVYEQGNPDGPTRGDGARLARLARAVGRRRAAAGRPVPDRSRYDNRGAGKSSCRSRIGLHDGAAGRRLRGRHRRRQPRTSRCTCWLTTGARSRCGSTSPGPMPATRVASFTSVSGPSLDHLAAASSTASSVRTGRSGSARR